MLPDDVKWSDAPPKFNHMLLELVGELELVDGIWIDEDGRKYEISYQTSKAPDAGAPETKLTPAMIEAGAVALANFDVESETREEAVARIYRAMISAKSRK